MARWWPTALERRIALRYLRGMRGTRSASLQTTIAIGGIAVGVAALIVVLGVMNGLRDDLRDRILIASPHITVINFGPNLVMEDWRRELDIIRKDPDVVAAAPAVTTQTLVQNHSGYQVGTFVAGIEPGVGTHDVTQIDDAVHHGDARFVKTSPDADIAIILGDRLAQSLSVNEVGDRLRLLASGSLKRSATIGMPQPRFVEAEVTGIYHTGMFLYDNNYIFMSRSDAQEFAGLDSAVSDISVRVKDAWKAGAVASRLQTALGYPSSAQTWQEQNASLFAALRMEKVAMALVIFFIMLVAAFNIVGTLTMVVAFKTREIGILQAMGLAQDGISRVFIAQGAVVGMIGTSIGLITGLAIALGMDRRITIDPDVYFIEKLPIHVEAFDVAGIVAIALLVAVLATIHPSRRAARLSPVDAIRAE
jgi:lipoprotein-releasing system permease protein